MQWLRVHDPKVSDFLGGRWDSSTFYQPHVTVVQGTLCCTALLMSHLFLKDLPTNTQWSSRYRLLGVLSEILLCVIKLAVFSDKLRNTLLKQINPAFSYFAVYIMERSLSKWVCKILKAGGYFMSLFKHRLPHVKVHLPRKGNSSHTQAILYGDILFVF